MDNKFQIFYLFYDIFIKSQLRWPHVIFSSLSNGGTAINVPFLHGPVNYCHCPSSLSFSAIFFVETCFFIAPLILVADFIYGPPIVLLDLGLLLFSNYFVVLLLQFLPFFLWKFFFDCSPNFGHWFHLSTSHCYSGPRSITFQPLFCCLSSPISAIFFVKFFFHCPSNFICWIYISTSYGF